MSTKLVKTEIAIERGKRLRFARGITGLRPQMFGFLCGIGRTTISTWEQGLHPLTEKGADKVVRGLREEGIECTNLWLLHGIGDTPKIIDQHKLSKLNYEKLMPSFTSSVEEKSHYYDDRQFEQEIELFKSQYPKHIIYNIQDETMQPLYKVGDWIGGIELFPDQLEFAHGLDCIVRLRNGITLARRVKTSGIGGFKLSLYGINSEFIIEHPPLLYLPITQVQAIAPIVRLWRHYFYPGCAGNTSI